MVPGVTGSDYVNANFVDGFKGRKSYIATQGPLEDTVGAFWRMLWEREVDFVVMLTLVSENGRAKSEQYWPDADEESLTFGDFQILWDEGKEQAASFGVKRSLRIVNLVSEATRSVVHWQFTAWPDKPSAHAAQAPKMIELYSQLMAHQDAKILLPAESVYGNADAVNEQARLAQLKPVVVHCSAGVGRTGAFITILNCIRQLTTENTVDVFTTVKHLRTQRMKMVDTVNEYEFVYRVLTTFLDDRGAAVAPAANAVSLPQRPKKAASGPADDGPPLPTKAASFRKPPAAPAAAANDDEEDDEEEDDDDDDDEEEDDDDDDDEANGPARPQKGPGAAHVDGAEAATSTDEVDAVGAILINHARPVAGQRTVGSFAVPSDANTSTTDDVGDEDESDDELDMDNLDAGDVDDDGMALTI